MCLRRERQILLQNIAECDHVRVFHHEAAHTQTRQFIGRYMARRTREKDHGNVLESRFILKPRDEIRGGVAIQPVVSNDEVGPAVVILVFKRKRILQKGAAFADTAHHSKVAGPLKLVKRAAQEKNVILIVLDQENERRFPFMRIGLHILSPIKPVGIYEDCFVSQALPM